MPHWTQSPYPSRLPPLRTFSVRYDGNLRNLDRYLDEQDAATCPHCGSDGGWEDCCHEREADFDRWRMGLDDEDEARERAKDRERWDE